jgi:hypothetical protein
VLTVALAVAVTAEGWLLDLHPGLGTMPRRLLDLMPYVVALEVAHPWSDGFAGAVEELSIDIVTDRWEWSAIPLAFTVSNDGNTV